MKKLILGMIAIGFASIALFFTSCNSPSQKVDNAQTDVRDAQEDLAKAQQAYIDDVQNYRLQTAERITANNQAIADFNARIVMEKADAKAEYQMKITELEKKNSDMKRRLDDYRAESKDEWATFKNEFNRDMDQLGTALKDLTIKNN